MQKKLIWKEFEDVKKNIILLKASIYKYKPYDINKVYTSDELEYYDSLSFRFEKCIELMLNFFKGLEIFLYSINSDTLRDRLLKMEKINIIGSMDFWMESRLLRNKISHAYLPERLKYIYSEINIRSKTIFFEVDKIEKYINNI